jgi:hypothetical protein
MLKVPGNMSPQTVLSPGYGSILSLRTVFAVVAVYFTFKVLQALYNISPLHPLSRFPGPRLAAATWVPEFWHDVVRFGCYTKEIRKMHDKYGTSARIYANGIYIGGGN